MGEHFLELLADSTSCGAALLELLEKSFKIKGNFKYDWPFGTPHDEKNAKNRDYKKRI